MEYYGLLLRRIFRKGTMTKQLRIVKCNTIFSMKLAYQVFFSAGEQLLVNFQAEDLAIQAAINAAKRTDSEKKEGTKKDRRWAIKYP